MYRKRTENDSLALRNDSPGLQSDPAGRQNNPQLEARPLKNTNLKEILANSALKCQPSTPK